MDKIFRVIGPPGCGKTTNLTRQIDAAAKKYGPNGVVVASFTKTAAQELSSRNPLITGVGTMHSHAFHAIGHRRVAEEMAAEFSAAYPRYKMSGSKASAVDVGFDAAPQKASGDALLAQLNILRAKMVPHEMWPANIRSFDSAWMKFKYENDAVDFTDMLEIALRDTSHAPGDPAVFMVDEYQDSSPLMHALATKWARRCDSFVVSGDADQAIFTFAGSDPAVMMGEVDKEIVLSQSYRCSQAVHAYARRWVKQIKGRTDYEYHPTTQEGFVRHAPYTLKMHRELVDDVEKYTAAGKSVMILASCSYMLSPIISEMRERGLLFHNPWRPSNGAWNPVRLVEDDSDTITTLDKVLAFLAPSPDVWGDAHHLWTADEFAAWAAMIRSDCGINKGMKKALADIGGPERVDMTFFADFFGEQASFWEMFSRFEKSEAIKWFRESLTASASKAAHYPIKVVERYNTSIEPKISIGTIHSVKGAEADVVIVAPDLSYSGVQEAMGRQTQRDGVYRLFYVALTRAREGVVLCGQTGNNAIRWL